MDSQVRMIGLCPDCATLRWFGLDCPECGRRREVLLEVHARAKLSREGVPGADIDPMVAARALGELDAMRGIAPHEFERFEGHGGAKIYLEYMEGYNQGRRAA